MKQNQQVCKASEALFYPKMNAPVGHRAERTLCLHGDCPAHQPQREIDRDPEAAAAFFPPDSAFCELFTYLLWLLVHGVDSLAEKAGHCPGIRKSAQAGEL
jgi:hypothetical protein